MPVSLFGMLPITTDRQRFTYVGPIPQPWLPTVLRLTVATLPHGLVTRRSSGGNVVPDASHPGVTPDARPGRVPVAEHRIFLFPDQYTCDLVSHVRGRRRAQVCGRSGAQLCGAPWRPRHKEGCRQSLSPGGIGCSRRVPRGDTRQSGACIIDGVFERLDDGQMRFRQAQSTDAKRCRCHQRAGASPGAALVRPPPPARRPRHARLDQQRRLTRSIGVHIQPQRSHLQSFA